MPKVWAHGDGRARVVAAVKFCVLALAKKRRFNLVKKMLIAKYLPKVLLTLALCWFAGILLAAAAAYKDLEWLDLMPKDEVEALQKAQGLPVNHDAKGEQEGSYATVPGVNNTKIRLAGYVVPVEQNDDGQLTEFFFVPYFGACIHVPPPPPNNIVYVKMAKPIPAADMFNAYWLEGTIKTERLSNDIAATAYVMTGDTLKLYE
jgi:hypothetical protein